MKHLFIPYPLAVLAKEKGFNEPCISHYMIEDSDYEMGSKKVIKLKPLVNSSAILTGIRPQAIEFNICAPLYQQIVDWFREEHKLSIVPSNAYIDDDNYFVYRLLQDGRKHLASYKNIDKAIEQAFKLI